MTDDDEALLNDTPETAPAMPRGQRVINAERSKELRESSQFKALKAKFRADCARTNAECHLCQDVIDYRLQHPHPQSFSVDHIVTVKENPALLMDINNLAASHLDCNLCRNSDEIPLALGSASEVW